MKDYNGVLLTGGLFILIVSLIPYLPDMALELFDHPMFRVSLILIVLIAIGISPAAGVAVLLLVGAILIQRNSRKMRVILHFETATSEMPRMKEDESMPVSPSIHYVADDEPAADVTYFAPLKDSGSDEFGGFSSGMDYKFVPEPAPLSGMTFKGM